MLSIAIGVFAVGIISGMNDLMPSRMLGSYSATNPAHVVIYLDGRRDGRRHQPPGARAGRSGHGRQRSLGAQWRLTPDMPWRNASFVMRNYEQQKFNTIEAAQRRVADQGYRRR